MYQFIISSLMNFKNNLNFMILFLTITIIIFIIGSGFSSVKLSQKINNGIKK